MSGALTEARIRDLPKGQVLMCGRLSGFGVSKSPKLGKVRFFIRRKIDGTDVRETIGKHPEMSASTARKVAAQELVSARNGSDKQVPSISDDLVETAKQAALNAVTELFSGRPVHPSTTRSSMSLGDFATNQIFPAWEELAPNSKTSYRNLWNVAIAPRWATTDLSDVTASGIAEWFMSLRDRKQTANHAFVLLRSMLKRAHSLGLIESVPHSAIKKYKLAKRDGLTERQLARLIRQLEILLETEPGPQLWAIITMLNTGERREACVSLRCEEVDFERLEIRRARKGGGVNAIPMTDYAAEFLRQIRPRDGDFFFPSKLSKTGHINGQSLLRWFKKLCVKLKLRTAKGRTPVIHELRHTWASTLARNGVPLTHIQMLLGHKSLITTMRYVHGDKDAARMAANVVSETRVALPIERPAGIGMTHLASPSLVAEFVNLDHLGLPRTRNRRN